MKPGELVRVTMRRQSDGKIAGFWQTWPFAVGDVLPVRHMPGVWEVARLPLNTANGPCHSCGSTDCSVQGRGELTCNGCGATLAVYD